jgi:hypothetical protein
MGACWVGGRIPAHLCVFLHCFREVTCNDENFQASKKGEFHHACGGSRAVPGEDEGFHQGWPRRVLLIGQPSSSSWMLEFGREAGLRESLLLGRGVGWVVV